MTQINFPVATEDGQTFNAPNGVVYTYVGTPPNGYWSGTFQNEGFTTLDGRYLKLDSSNDPVTGGLNITNGNVGISTLTPRTTLEVKRGSNGTEYYPSNLSTFAGAIINGNDATEENGLFVANRWAGQASTTLEVGSLYSSEGVYKSYIHVDGTGQIGFGTSNPSSNFEFLRSQPTVTIRDSETSLTTAKATLRLAESGAGSTLDNLWDITADNTAGNFGFSIKENADTRLAIRAASGNVGIATSNPFTTLHVNNSGSGTAIASSGATDATTAFRVGRTLVGIDFGILDSGTSYLQNRNVNNFATNYNFLLQPNGGNVGIRSTNPDMLLQIGQDTPTGCVRIGKTRAYMLAGDSNSGAVYFGPTLSNPTGGIEASWDSANNRPTVTVGVIRDGNGQTGGGAKPKTAWRYDNTIKNYINNEEIYTVGANGITMPSGKGISFNVAGGSGTATSGQLDDYEEGNWTPTLVDATGYSVQRGRYTKIGRHVFVQFQVWTTSANLSTNAVEIGGLPFQSASSSSAYGGAIQTYDSLINQTGIPNYRLHIPSNSTAIRALSNGSPIATNNGNAKVVGNHIFAGWYIAA